MLRFFLSLRVSLCANVLLNVLNNERIMKMCARRTQNKLLRSAKENRDGGKKRGTPEKEQIGVRIAGCIFIVLKNGSHAETGTNEIQWPHIRFVRIFPDAIQPEPSFYTHTNIYSCRTIFFIWIFSRRNEKLQLISIYFFLSFSDFLLLFRLQLVTHKHQYTHINAGSAYKRAYYYFVWSFFFLSCFFLLVLDSYSLLIQGRIRFGISFFRTVDFIFVCDVKVIPWLVRINILWTLIKRSNWVMIKIDNTFVGTHHFSSFTYIFQRIFCTLNGLNTHRGCTLKGLENIPI